MLRLTALSLLVLLLAVGCDRSGIHPIGEVLDITPNCDPMNDAENTTWLRTMVDDMGQPIGTELVVLGFDPTAASVPDMGKHCMQRIKVYRSTTTEEHLGVVTLNGAGSGIHTEGVHCDFPIEPQHQIFTVKGTPRRGAQCYDLSYRGLVQTPFTFAMASGNILEVTWGADEPPTLPEDLEPDGVNLRAPEMGDRIAAGTYRYQQVGDLLATLDTSTMAGAEGVFQLFNIALLASQSRLAGFGSSGMTQYLNTTSTFVGLISSSYTVHVENFSMPRTTIRYTQFEDLTGLIIGSAAGDDQITTVNTSANGGMEGALSFFLLRDRTTPSSAITGALDYADVQIISGFGSAGTYHLTIDEASTTYDLDVDTMIGYDNTLPGYGKFDLSPILPSSL